MPKDWKKRLADTIKKIREGEGDVMADRIQRIVDVLPDERKKDISKQLSIGWRIWWHRGDERTQNRRGRRAAKLNLLLDKYGQLGLAMRQAVQNTPSIHSINELELRLISPRMFYMGFIGSPNENRTTQSQYDWALNNSWANSCGGFSAVLKDIISDNWATVLQTKEGQRKSRNQVFDRLGTEMRKAANKYLRVDLGCHSFIIEKYGSYCRLYQVYMAQEYGGYNFAEDMNNPVVMAPKDFISRIEKVIKNEEQANADGTADALFKGSCWPSNNAKQNQEVYIEVEVTTAPRTKQGMAEKCTTMTDSLNEGWQAALANQTVRAYNQAYFA